MNYTYITISIETRDIKIHKEQIIKSKNFFIEKTVENWKNLLYDHEIYYFKCKSNGDNKLIFNFIEDHIYIDIKNKTNSKILNKQAKDIKFLFKNKMFDVLYVIPQIELDKNYYFDFLVFLNKYDLCKIDAIRNEKFKLIKIDKIFTLKNFEVDFDIVNSILNLDSKFINNASILNKYDFDKEYNKYINSLFSLLCTQIHSFDKLPLDLEKTSDSIFFKTNNLNFKLCNSIKHHYHFYLIKSLIYTDE